MTIVDESSELLGRQRVINFVSRFAVSSCRGITIEKDSLRKFKGNTKYPSVAKIKDAIAGSRRMDSPITVENYINGVAKFTKYAGFSNPEKLLEAM